MGGTHFPFLGRKRYSVLEVCRQLEEAGVRDYVVFEALCHGGETAEECMGLLQDREGRGDVQKSSYLFLLDKAMAQLGYLKRHADITALKPAEGRLRKCQLELVERAKAFLLMWGS